jgi:hypothetical protein
MELCSANMDQTIYQLRRNLGACRGWTTESCDEGSGTKYFETTSR